MAFVDYAVPQRQYYGLFVPERLHCGSSQIHKLERRIFSKKYNSAQVAISALYEKEINVLKLSWRKYISEFFLCKPALYKFFFNFCNNSSSVKYGIPSAALKSVRDPEVCHQKGFAFSYVYIRYSSTLRSGFVTLRYAII